MKTPAYISLARGVFKFLVLFWLAGMSAFAYATNGYFTHGVGVKMKGLAGANVAMPSESMSAATNPAAAVLVGDRYEMGSSLFSPRRSYSVSTSLANGAMGTFTVGSGKQHSDSDFFLIPYIGKTFSLNHGRAVSFNFYGRGGMNTNWSGGTATFDPDGPGPMAPTTFAGTFGDGRAGVNLSQAFLDTAYAQTFGKLHIGAAVVLGVQGFKAKGLDSFAPLTRTFAQSGGTRLPTHLSDNGTSLSYGVGFKIGGIYQLNNQLNLGLSYQAKIHMSDFDEYSDLFAEGGGFDIPASAHASVSYQANSQFSIHLDFEKSWYSDVDSIGNSIANVFLCPTAGFGGSDVNSCLGGDRGPGFSWADVEVVKVGLQWQLLPRTTTRFGFSQSKQPISSNEMLFNILAPGVTEQHLTIGLTQKLSDGRELSVAFMYAPSKKVSGPNNFDPTQSISLEMKQFELEFGFQF